MDDVWAFEAWGNFTQLQWSVEDLCEDGNQLVTHRLGLVASFSCSFWRPSVRYHILSAVHLWGRAGCWRCEWCFFQTCSRTRSDRLPVVDSPQCWGMVSCNWWCLSYLSSLKHSRWKIICFLAFQNNSYLPIWSPFPLCIWPLYTKLCCPSS